MAKSKYKIVNGERVLMDDSEHQQLEQDEQEAIERKRREDLRNQFTSEGLDRIEGRVRDWNSLNRVELIRSIWGQLSNKTAEQLEAANIYVYVVDDVLPNIDAIPADDLSVVDPLANDPFAGTSFDGTADDPGPWPA
jgi:hypothetical protein